MVVMWFSLLLLQPPDALSSERLRILIGRRARLGCSSGSCLCKWCGKLNWPQCEELVQAMLLTHRLQTGTLLYSCSFSFCSDKSVIVWQLERTEGQYGVPKRSLTGHSHFVQDVVISSDGQFALSGSWDGTLRLWDLQTGQTTRRFVGHDKDVLSVAFSVDNRQVGWGEEGGLHAHHLWDTWNAFSACCSSMLIIYGVCLHVMKSSGA